MLAIVIAVILVVAVVAILASPWGLRAAGAERQERDSAVSGVRAEILELQAARDAKYREIRDAELDRQTGKLSEDDFNAADATLRAEAISLLKQLDQAEARLAKLEPEAEQDQSAAE